MDNYKGIYYNATNEQKSFEGGAHFRYNDLYRALSALVSLLPPERINTCSDSADNEKNQHNKAEEHIETNHIITVEEVKTENRANEKAELKSRNKQTNNNLFQGISITAVNAGPGQNTQIVLSGNNTSINIVSSNNTTNDLPAHINLHSRQKSENNNNVNINNLNLNNIFSSKLTTFSGNNNNNLKCKSSCKPF